MRHDETLEELWESAPPSTGTFSPDAVSHLPPVARRYLLRALPPGARLGACARLAMTGTLKLAPGWCPFEAEQVLRWDRGFVWAARARVNGLPVTGFDRLVDGEGAMRWRLFGLFPVVRVDGEQIARSAAGRLHAESIWLPSVLLGPDVSWTDLDEHRTIATIDAHGERSELELRVAPDGALRACRLLRWGDLDTGEFAYHPFGGLAEGEASFDDVVLPTRYRVGWGLGEDGFDGDGEFFRCTLESVRYR